MTEWTLPPDGGHMDRPTGIYLQTMTGKETQERLRKNDLIIIPIGSTENHGPHACSGEDTFLVTRMAEQIAQKTGCSRNQCNLDLILITILVCRAPSSSQKEPLLITCAIIAGLWNSGFRKANLVERAWAGLCYSLRFMSLVRSIKYLLSLSM
jgi:creatinine amidohydrolase